MHVDHIGTRSAWPSTRRRASSGDGSQQNRKTSFSVSSLIAALPPGGSARRGDGTPGRKAAATSVASPQDNSSQDERRTSIRSVSSLIASLPTAAHLHRTIDDFYSEAHRSIPICKASDVLVLFFRRLAYFMCFVALGVANVGDAAEIGSMGYLLAHEGFRRDILHGKDGIIASSLYIGMLFGGIIAGPLCDQRGRRVVLLGGLFLNSALGVASAYSTATWELALYRVGIGFGIGAIVSCLLALTSEHTPPTLRGRYLNFVSAFWTVGSIFVAVLALLLFGVYEKSWRLYVLINAVPSGVALILVALFCPESARFLALRGKQEEATKVANRVATAMGFRGDLLSLDEVNAHYPPEPIQSSQSTQTFWRGLLDICAAYSNVYRHAQARKRLLMVQAMWFVASIGSGMSLWIVRIFEDVSIVKDLYTVSLFFALSSIPGVIVSGFLIDRVGRPWLLTMSFLCTTMALLAFAILTLFVREGWCIVLTACCFHSCVVVTWSALSVVTAESFPTSLRSTAMGLCTACGRVASISVHLISAVLVGNNHPATLLSLGSAGFAIGVLLSIQSGLESRTGVPLEDIEPIPRQRSNKQKSNELPGIHRFDVLPTVQKR